MKGVTVEDMREEIEDMLAVCFEGEVCRKNGQIYMILPDGQRFNVSIEEDAA